MRYIKNFIKLRELTAEDRYRKSKGLPSKEEESPYDILEKYKDDPMVMISFRNEYYSKTKRLGINLQSSFNTPNGIYCYPLSLMWKKFDHENRKISGVPFTGKQGPKSIVVMRLKGKGLDLKDYDEQDYYNDIDILRSNFPRTLDFHKYEQQTKSYFLSLLSDYSTVEFDKNYIDSYYLWGVTRGIFNEIKPKSKNTNYWNFIFSKILGYKWVLDKGLGIIYKDEPIQCVIFENSAYDLIDSIDISKIDYRVSRDELSVENKLVKKIYNLVMDSSETNNKKIKFLLDKYPSLMLKPFDLLHVACRNNNIEIVKLLLGYPNIDVNIQDKFRRTPLHLACEYNNIEIVKLLLEHPDIDVSIKDTHERTPLHLACEYNSTKVVKLLLKHPDIDVNSQNNNGKTPLHVACLSNNIQIVKLLLSQSKIDVNIKDNNGRTPLYVACENNHIEIVKLLLDHPKIDVNAEIEVGKTPLSIAKKYKNQEIIDLLIQHGATE